MKVPLQVAPSLSHPAIVGTIHSVASLAEGLTLEKPACDWLELRVDNFFPKHISKLLKAAHCLRIPPIVTIRHTSEGGMAKGMTTPRRRTLFTAFLTVAGLFDIELRQARAMAPVLAQAREAHVGVILSYHNFHRTPPARQLRDLACKAQDAGANIFKVATLANDPRDLATLIQFLANEKSTMPIAAMGMGRFGKISRLVLAEAGSCLNYGFIGKPNASGQWPVALLKARIAELRTTTPPAPGGSPGR